MYDTRRRNRIHDRNADGQDEFRDSMLDFVFVANHARDWHATSTVIARPNDFPDNEETSDHRPVEAVFTRTRSPLPLVDRRNEQGANLPLPTLNAYERFIDGSTYWLMWCEDCQVWHRHGPAEGKREAHCTGRESPYWRDGYVLKFAGKWDDRQ